MVYRFLPFPLSLFTILQTTLTLQVGLKSSLKSITKILHILLRISHVPWGSEILHDWKKSLFSLSSLQSARHKKHSRIQFEFSLKLIYLHTFMPKNCSRIKIKKDWKKKNTAGHSFYPHKSPVSSLVWRFYFFFLFFPGRNLMFVIFSLSSVLWM